MYPYIKTMNIIRNRKISIFLFSNICGDINSINKNGVIDDDISLNIG